MRTRLRLVLVWTACALLAAGLLAPSPAGAGPRDAAGAPAVAARLTPTVDATDDGPITGADAPPLTATMSAEPGEAAPLCGRAVDLSTGAPVVGAWITAPGTSAAVTDEQGRFCLTVPPEAQEIGAEADGYLGMSHALMPGAMAAGADLLLEMIPNEPTPEQVVALDERILHRAPAEPDAPLDLIQGYSLSAVTEAPETIRVLMPDGSVQVMEMEEYLKGVLPSEMPASWDLDALKAQAVAARSYAAVSRKHADEGADVCTTTHCQAWKPVHYATTDRAVEETRGIVALEGGTGRVITAFYFAHSDGHTRNSEDVWSVALSYCRSVPSPCGYDFLWGHGVGMAQVGAGVMARQGYSYEEILKHYYTGITLSGAGTGQIVSAEVSPASGDANTPFRFSLECSAQEAPPAVANVVIDGRAHALDRVLGAEERRFETTMRLAPGQHSYRFYVAGEGGSLRWPADGSTRSLTVAEAPPDPDAPATTTRAHSFTLGTTADWSRGMRVGAQVLDVADGSLTLSEGAATGSYLSEALGAPYAFVALGATWLAEVPPGAALAVEARVAAVDDGAWGPWRELAPSDEGDARAGLAVSDLSFQPGRVAQVRLTLRRAPGGETPLVKNLRLVCIDSTPGPSAPAGLPAPAGLESGLAAHERPRVISRAAWGADESLMTWPPAYRTVRAIVLHHTVSGDDEVDPAAAVRAVYYYHAVIREWGDIGYNYLVDRAGNVYEGRAGGSGVVGGHALQYNWGSIGISLIGNYHEQDVPEAMRQGLVNFLAWQCVDHLLDPLGEGYFIDQRLPTLFGHRDGADTLCPGDRAYALLPAIRQGIRDEMDYLPPRVLLSAPVNGQAIRGVSDLQARASVNTERVRFYVNDAPRHVDSTFPYTWKWNTVDEVEASHEVRLVAENGVGEAQAAYALTVDNTPPVGTASAPAWTNTRGIEIALSSPDAAAVQFSDGWVWEGEALHHAASSGLAVDDADALNGRAWLGRGGDAPGAWYGPYTCDPPAGEYDVYFRVKAADVSGDVGLATLDVADHGPGGVPRVYDLRALSSADLSRAGVYEPLRLSMAYAGDSAGCGTPGGGGIEFRTWFSGAGDLYLDRVTVFRASQPLAPTAPWTLRNVEGAQKVLVRFLDEAGNGAEQELTVGLDRAAPAWSHIGLGSAWTRDPLSGIDPGRVAWSSSSDGGATWGAWQPLALPIPPGTTVSLPLIAPDKTGTHVRFRVADMAGNESESGAIALQAPTPTLPPTVSPYPSPASTQRVLLPLVLRPASD